MSETVSRLGVPRSDFSEDIGAPTPTRFLLECGEYRLTPGLSSFGELNPFEASFTSCGKKDSIPATNTAVTYFSSPPSSVNTIVPNVQAPAIGVLSTTTSMPVNVYTSEKRLYETSHQFVASKLSEPASKLLKTTSRMSEGIPDQYSSSDESQLDKLEKSTGFKRKNSNNPEKDEEKRRRFLERNRVAASKCRQKKKVWVKELEHKSDEITAKNKQLQNIVGQLKEELLQLKSQLLGHRNCNCNVIQQYVQTSGHFSQLPDGVSVPLSGIIAQANTNNMLSKQSSISASVPMGSMVGPQSFTNN